MQPNPDYYCKECSGALMNTAAGRECEDCGAFVKGWQPDAPEIIEP